ncbi:MAG: hypothetical protein IKH55_07880 [Fibrobacter sp.]|nr:hypothetical protein [Fibrobacter sp.]
MKKILFTIMFVLAVFANADGLLDVNTYCNDGKNPVTNEYNQPGITDTSCVLVATKVNPGFDMPVPVSGGIPWFFFDSGTTINIPGYTKPVGIRFCVFSDEANYNAVQAIVQTAYATRAPVSIIFSNPTRTGKPYDLATFHARRANDKNCFKAEDLNGDIVSIVCPIESIQLGSN